MEFEIDVFDRMIFYVNNSTEKFAVKQFCESNGLVLNTHYLIKIKEEDGTDSI